MADARRSALAGVEAAMAAACVPGVVTLRELEVAEQTDLRGDAGAPAFLEAVRAAVGLTLPTEPNRFTAQGGVFALWLGPDEWLLVRDSAAELPLAPPLRDALTGLHAAITDVSAARTVLELSGPKAREVLAKGCPLDLHPRAFGPGQCAQTLLAKAQMLLQQTDAAPTWRIHVRPSFARYLAEWLIDAMEEYRS